MRHRRPILLVFLMLLSGHARADSKADQNPKVNLQSHFFKDKLGAAAVCDPAITFRFSTGPIVGLCGGVAVKTAEGKTFYAARDKKPLVLVMQTTAGSASVLLRGAKGLTQYKVDLLANNGLELTETLKDGTSTYTLFQRDLICDTKACVLSDNRCSWNLLNNLYPHALVDFNRDLDAAPPTSDAVLKQDVNHLFLHGLAGDGAARARLHVIAPDFAKRLDLRIDEREALIKRARTLKCID